MSESSVSNTISTVGFFEYVPDVGGDETITKYRAVQKNPIPVFLDDIG
jgi:hypothetical protein